MSNQVLSCENVTASYGAIQALHGVNLEVNQGEIVVVLGANGAGKTTTLRAICNMVATEGTVMLNGSDISKADTADIVNAGVAHVPQGRGTFAALTVLENLEVGAYTRTDDEVQSDIEMWFEKYPVLGERRTQAAGSLSGGEQQMLAVARAAMSRPTMMLLDEPSLGLAPLIIEDLFQTFAQLNKEQGTSMLLVEQNYPFATALADRLYVLGKGQVRWSGTPAALAADDDTQRAWLGI